MMLFRYYIARTGVGRGPRLGGILASRGHCLHCSLAAATERWITISESVTRTQFASPYLQMHNRTVRLCTLALRPSSMLSIK